MLQAYYGGTLCRASGRNTLHCQQRFAYRILTRPPRWSRAATERASRQPGITPKLALHLGKGHRPLLFISPRYEVQARQAYVVGGLAISSLQP